LFAFNYIQGQEKSFNFLELKYSNGSTFAKIDLTQGGSLQELKLGNKALISTENEIQCNNIFRSSILFPFANRIKNGRYQFKNQAYELEKNEDNGQNAIHGLVYDKTFRLVGHEASETSASVTMAYEETQPVSGFPFKYGIILKYVLTANTLELHVEIRNKDKAKFPFSLGWHPYFKTNDLYNCYLKLKSQKKILVDGHMIPNGEDEINWDGFLKIEDKAFDDCFILNTNKAEFKTPDYHIEFSFSPHKNYLQLYTPNDRKSIAIEPQTSPANSFNTKKGLQILHPNEKFNLSWKIKLK